MSDKYIIKNCPARLPESGLCIEAPKKKAYSCQDCTACLLKGIAEECKRLIGIGRDDTQDVLDLLDIQEVD